MYHKKIIYLRELIFILNYVKYIKHILYYIDYNC